MNTSSPSTDFALEAKKLELERFKAKLEFQKAIIVSGFVAVTIALIPPLFQLATAFLEYVKAGSDRTVKQQEFRDSYIKDFLANALNQDIELRIRFAEYFANVSDEKYRDSWVAYLQTLTSKRKNIRDQIDETELKYHQSANASPPNQVEREKFVRRLGWAYNEAGYVAPNRSVTVDPRAPSSQQLTSSAISIGGDNPAQAARYTFGGNRQVFYAKIQSTLLTGMTPTQKDSVEAILDYWLAKYKDSDSRILAYILATALHETNRSLLPIEEPGRGKGTPYGVPDSSNGNVYYGRGFVQLTWAQNYRKVGSIIGVNLYDNPELALTLNNSSAIIVEGLVRGLFTGRRLSDYFSGETSDWINARRVVSGLDRAAEIAAYARSFFAALENN